jgi:hypothetical protein
MIIEDVVNLEEIELPENMLIRNQIHISNHTKLPN